MPQGRKGTSNKPKRKARRCNAIKADGKRCKKYAVSGKDKCKHHGGATPIKTGRYSKYVKDNMKDKYEEFLFDDDLRSLRSEIALLRLYLTNALRITEDQDEDAKVSSMEHVIRLCDNIRKSVTALVQIEDGLRLTLDIGQLQCVLNQVVDIIEKEVKDDAIVNRISSQFEKLAISDHRTKTGKKNSPVF